MRTFLNWYATALVVVLFFVIFPPSIIPGALALVRMAKG